MKRESRKVHASKLRLNLETLRRIDFREAGYVRGASGHTGQQIDGCPQSIKNGTRCMMP